MNLAGRKICAVVVTWNPDDAFPQRLEAIRAQVDCVVIVDNASTGNSAAMLKALCPSHQCLRNDENLGVASALNLGVTWADAHGYPRVVLFDQDTQVDDGLVERLCDEWKAWSGTAPIGVLGARFVDVRRHVPLAQCADTAGSDAVDWVITSGSLLLVELWRKLGGFRDDLFIDFVDTEFCWRVRHSGYAVLRTRAVLMQHAVGAYRTHRLLGRTTCSSHHSADRRYYMTRNFIILLRESGNHPAGGWLLRGMLASFKSVKRILFFEQDKRAKLAAVIQGWYHGLRNRTGPRSRPLSPHHRGAAFRVSRLS